jgi:hypothetical protein
VPFIDFAVYFPEGNKIEYLTTSSGYAHSLASFFIPWKDIGISAGVRLEVLAAVLMVAVYIHLKTGSLLKAAGGSIAVYFFAVSSMCFPVFFLLPAAIVFPLDFDIIINSFLNDCPVKCTLLNRISLMILFLLTAYTVIAFYLYDKKNVFFLLRNTFFHKLSFVFPVLYLLGFITASVSTSVINDCPFFQSTFAWFYLLSGLLFSFLIAGSIKLLINSSFSFPAVFLIIVFLFPHLFSINISYSVFMCSLAAGCIAFLLFKSPFAGMFYKKTIFPFLFSFIYVIIFLAGFSSIAGVSSPASLPFVIIFCIYAAFFIYHYLSASVKLKK